MTANVPARSFVLMVDEELIPLEPGSIAVDASSGQLKRAAGHRSFGFGFTFAGLPFTAQACDDEGMIRVDCMTTIGRMPYTIEDRQRRIDLGYALGTLMGTGLSWHLTDAQAVEIAVGLRLEAPATAARIVVALVEALLPVEDYLAILGDLARPHRATAVIPAFAPSRVR